MKAREIKKAKRLVSSLMAMTVLLAGASVFADGAYNPDKVTVTSDNFESYSTGISKGGDPKNFSDSYASTDQFTLLSSSDISANIDSETYPRLTSYLDDFKESDSFKNLTDEQKKNLQMWMIVDGENRNLWGNNDGDFTGWGRSTVFNIVNKDDKNNNATLNDVTENSFLRVNPIAGMQNFALYKKLNTDSDIQNKELTFKVSFKIPQSGMKYAGDGFGIWLNNEDMSKISTWSNFEYALDSGNQSNTSNSYHKRELMAIKPMRENGEVKIKLYAFGNVVNDNDGAVTLDKDAVYTYTLKMTPDSSDGYTLTGSLSKDGEDGKAIWFSPTAWEAYAYGAPKRNDIKDMTHMTVMAAHAAGTVNNDIAANASNQDEKYVNGHSMIYVDDISLTADYTYPTREMNGSGLSATARKNGNNVYVNVKNTEETEKTVKLIAAVYDGEKLKKVKIDNTASSINSNEAKKVDFTFTDGEIADGNKVKVFIWDSLSDVTPLTTAAEF